MVVDFQILSFAPGLFDVGYFLIRSAEPKREKHDKKTGKTLLRWAKEIRQSPRG